MWKKIITSTNILENKHTIERVNKCESLFFERTNIIDKVLVRFIRKKLQVERLGMSQL